MAVWCRMKQSQLKILANQFKRCYFQIHGPCPVVNHTASLTRIRVLDRYNWSQLFEFRNNVRFFAAPVQVKPKQEEKDTTGPRLNEKIPAQFVRLVTDQGHDVVSKHEALERARRLKLDLVEVQRSAKPPVCKLMDYHKEKYKQQIKEKDRAKGKSEVALRKGDCKEVRIAGKIEQKDLQMKANMVKRLMERGYRVKCMAMGTEAQDLGGLLCRLSALIEDDSIVESGPRVEKKQAYVIVRHVKFGPSKKGSGKKASKVLGATSFEVQSVAVSPPTINPSTQSTLQFEENLDAAESGLETEDDILSEEEPTSPLLEMADEDLEKNKSAWSVLDKSDDFDQVFDLRNDVNGVAKSSTHGQMEITPEIPSSPANSFSEVLRPRPLLDSTRPPASSSSPSEAPLVTENRYRREPINRFPPTKQTNDKGPDARYSLRLEPQIPNQGRQPQFDLNTAPPLKETPRLEPQFPNQGRQPQFDLHTPSPSKETRRVEHEASIFRNLRLPANEFPKQEASGPSSPTSPAPNYGMFSAPKANDSPEKQSAPAAVNRYNKGVNPNSRASNSDGSRRG